MRNSLFLVFCFCGSATASLAQQTPPALVPLVGAENRTQRVATLAATAPQDQPSIPDPVYLLNGHYIGSGSVLSTLNPQQIVKLEIYKPGSGPVQWRSLTVPGIISITLKAKLKTKMKARSLVAIKRGLGLHSPVRFEFNGAPIQDESLQIITSAIAGLEVIPAAPGTAAETVVNIRSAPYKPMGPQVVPLHPRVYPPGTILIRGLAQQ